jgi:predicted metal-dependent enzyme (double-stranded beta helix superfamily)
MRSNPDPAEFNEFPSWSLSGFPDSVASSAASSAADRAADRAASRTGSELVSQPLSRSRMKEIAREVAGSPGAWERLVRMDPDNRWHQRLYSAADYDVWLESWLPGQATGWHDHAGTAGVLVVARGELEERVSVLNGVFTQVRHVPEGMARRMGRRQVHNLANASLAPAVSIHVYSPPLGATRGYEIGAMGLMRSPWNASSRN